MSPVVVELKLDMLLMWKRLLITSMLRHEVEDRGTTDLHRTCELPSLCLTEVS